MKNDQYRFSRLLAAGLPARAVTYRGRFWLAVALISPVVALISPAVALISPVVAEPGSVSAELRVLLTRLPHEETLCGVMIVDLQTDETILSLRANEPMTPASNQKLIVMAAAIDQLGPQWAFVTRVGIRGDDLVLIGDGDPGLGDPRIAEAVDQTPTSVLDRWAEALIGAGYSRIAGDLVVDASIFDSQFVHRDWEEADLIKWYGAPVGGLNFNDNCVELTVWPAATDGAPALWELYPPCSLAQVVNRCRSSPGRAKATPIVTRRARTFDLILSGSVGRRSELQSVAVHQPNLFAAHVVREHLAARGVSVAGDLVFETVREPKGGLGPEVKVIARHVTPLPEVLRRVGWNSQNMFAESLFKRLGYAWAAGQEDRRAEGSWETGRAAAASMLRRAGCDLSRMVIADASGLSRMNRVTAADIVTILRYMHRHRDRELFVTSLAGNRTGGSLRKRMASLEADVYAKTGYMRGIRTLSGYVRTPGNRWFAFSVLFNGFSGSSRRYNGIHDKVCRILGEAGDATHIAVESSP